MVLKNIVNKLTGGNGTSAAASPAETMADKPAAEDPAADKAPEQADQPDPLRTALNAAKEALGAALRSLIANGVHDGTPERNRLENGFEAAKNALAGEAKLAHLENAVGQLKLAADILANHTLKDIRDLAAVKEAHAAAENALHRLQA